MSPKFDERNEEFEEEFSEERLEEMEEDDEITNVEEGVLQGYEEGDTMDSCANCKQALVEEDIIEEMIDDKMYRFCSTECAEEFERRKKSPMGK